MNLLFPLGTTSVTSACIYILDYEGILEGNSNYQLNDSMWGFSLALGFRVQKQSLASLAGICSGRKGCGILMKISLQLFLGNSLILKVKKSLLFEKPVQIVSIAVWPGNISQGTYASNPPWAFERVPCVISLGSTFSSFFSSDVASSMV